MSNDLNQVFLIGRLTRDPETKQTASGMTVTKFSIANGESYTKEGQKVEYTNFFDVTVWGRTAEICATYLKKGNQVGVVGKLRQETWTDNTTGQKRSKVGVTGINIQFLTPANSQNNQQQSQQQQNNFVNQPNIAQQNAQNIQQQFNGQQVNQGNNGAVDNPWDNTQNANDDDIPW